MSASQTTSTIAVVHNAGVPTNSSIFQYGGAWISAACALITLLFFVREKLGAKSKAKKLQEMFDTALESHDKRVGVAEKAAETSRAHAEEARRAANAAESSLTLMESQVQATRSLASSYDSQTHVSERQYKAYVNARRDEVAQELKQQLQIVVNIQHLCIRLDERLRDWKSCGHGLGTAYFNVVDPVKPLLSEQIMKLAHPHNQDALDLFRTLLRTIEDKEYAIILGTIKEMQEILEVIASNLRADTEKRMSSVVF